MGNEESQENENVVLGPNEIDAVYRPNVSFVGIEPEAKTPSEMSDAQRLETPEGQADLEKAAEEVAGGEVKKKETTPPAKEESTTKKETPTEEEVKAAEEEKAKTEKQEKYSKDVQKRINKITFEKHAEARRAERAETKLKERDEELRKATTEKARAEIVNKKPKETDFESEAEYYEALGRWSTRSEMLEIQSERATETTTDTSPAPTEDLPPEVQAMLELGGKTYDDFDDVVEKSKMLPQNLVEEAMELKEKAHDIIYYFAKNQDEAVRIAGLSPKAITREIGKIEAGLSASTTNETPEKKDSTEESVSSASSPPDKPSKPKQTTNAPPPITPVQPGATTTSADPNKMTNAEYRAHRGLTNSGMKKKRD